MGETVGARNFAWLSVGQVVFSISQWAVLSVLATLGGAEAVGEFALALAIVTPVFQLVRVRLREVVATDIESSVSFADYASMGLGSLLVGLPISVAVGVVLGVPASIIGVIAIMALARGVEGLSHIAYGHQQRINEMAPVGVSTMSRGALGLALVALGFAATNEVLWGAVGFLVGHVLIFGAYDFPRIREHLRSDRKQRPATLAGLWSLVLFSGPLGVFSFLSALVDNIPRLVLSSYADLSALGIFATFGYIIVGGSALTTALGQASTSTIATSVLLQDHIALGNHLRRLISLASLIGIGGILAATLFGEPFLRVFFGDDFARYSSEFVIMAFYGWSLFVSALLAITMIAARLSRLLLIIQASTVAVITLACIVLIPRLGIRGAVLALVIGGGIRAISLGIVLSRFKRSLGAIVSSNSLD